MKRLTVFLTAILMAGTLFAGTEDNPDRWPSLTIDGIHGTIDGDQSAPLMHNDILYLAKGHEKGFESLFKFPIASRITFRLGVDYLQYSLDNTIDGTRGLTKGDYSIVRYRFGITLYMAGSK